MTTWASASGDPNAIKTAAIQAANAARNAVFMPAYATYNGARANNAATWVDTVAPAYTTNATESADHALTCANATIDASATEANAEVGNALTCDTTVAPLAQAEADSEIDAAVDWVSSASGASATAADQNVDNAVAAQGDVVEAAKTELNAFADHCLTEITQIQSDALTLVNTLTGQMVAIISAMDAYLSGGGSTSPTSPSTSTALAASTGTASASPAGAAPSAPPSSGPSAWDSLGYALQATLGTVEMVAGVTIVAGGGYVEVISFGLATPVMVPAMLFGGALTLHGADMTTNAAYNGSVAPADRVEMITIRGAHALGLNDGELLAFAPMVTSVQLAPRIPAAAALVDKADDLVKAFPIPNAANGAKLNQHLSQLESYGTSGYKEMQNGLYRYFGKLTPASKPGEMVGRRVVREWNPETGKTRTWMETLDHLGRVRIVRPETGGDKIHYMFDEFGNFIGSF